MTDAPAFLGDTYTVTLNSIPGAAQFGRTADGIWVPILVDAFGGIGSGGVGSTYSVTGGPEDATTIRTIEATNSPIILSLGNPISSVPTDPTTTTLTQNELLRGIFQRALNMDVRDAAILADTSPVVTVDAGAYNTTVKSLADVRFTSANASAADAAVTAAPTSGQKLVIDDVWISVDTAMRVDLKEETSATTFVSIYLPANGTMALTARAKFKLAVADKKLMVRTSVSGNVAVTTFYHSEP